MKKKTPLAFLLLCIVVVSSLDVNAQAKKKTTTPVPAKPVEVPKESAPSTGNPMNEEMMKSWEMYMSPGEFHKMLEKDNGAWNMEITMWMDPSAPPQTSTATAENSMIMGGRYQQSLVKGDMSGMPFEGMSVVGYDNARKMIVSTWIDNMGTGLMYMEGTYDPKEKAINLKGKMTDPMTGQEIPVREVFQMIDEKTQLLTMFDTKNGKENKTMEIKYTRM